MRISYRPLSEVLEAIVTVSKQAGPPILLAADTDDHGRMIILRADEPIGHVDLVRCEFEVRDEYWPG